MSDTISYYDRNAEQYFSLTVHLDMSDFYARFLAHVPKGGRILDAGCGSGRDSLYFLRHGYEVVSFDASEKMCSLASRLISSTVLHKSFAEVDWQSCFDGLWASASLLHVSRADIDDVLTRLCHALKPGGVMFTSFKRRDAQWEQDGRFFNGYDEDSFRQMMNSLQCLNIIALWESEDMLPSRKGQYWLNALVVRT